MIYYRHNKASTMPDVIEKAEITFNELTFVIKGELNYLVNENSFSVKTGDCIFINAGSVRERSLSKNSDYVSFNFTEDCSFVSVEHFINCITPEINLIISACDEIHGSYYSWEDKIANAVSLIIKIIKDNQISNKENPLILKIKRFIMKNYSSKLSLARVAKEVGYSPNYCDTLFRKNTGHAITDFIIKERMKEAKRLLAEGVYSLKKIALTIGYEDYNYFTRTFKKQCGYTPSQYKSKLK